LLKEISNIDDSDIPI